MRFDVLIGTTTNNGVPLACITCLMQHAIGYLTRTLKYTISGSEISGMLQLDPV